MCFNLYILVPVLLAVYAEAQQGYRLTGGSTQYEGTVEVLRNGRWQTVCDDGWGEPEGHLVCSLLGYGSAAIVYVQAYFGVGVGNIWVKDWRCTGMESSLEECPSGFIVFCLDTEAAGVTCNPPVTTPDPTPTTSTTTSTSSEIADSTRIFGAITSSAITSSAVTAGTTSTTVTGLSASIAPTSRALPATSTVTAVGTASSSGTPTPTLTVTSPSGATALGGIPSYTWYIVGISGFLLVVGCMVITCCITCVCCCSRSKGCNAEVFYPWKCSCGKGCNNCIKTCCRPCKLCCSNFKFFMERCCSGCGRCLRSAGKACCLPFVLCGRCMKTCLYTMGRNIQLCYLNMARCIRNCCTACCRPIVKCFTAIGNFIKAAFINCGRCIQSCVKACCTPCVLCCTAIGNCTRCMCAAIGSCFRACGRGFAAGCYYVWICLCCPCIVFCSDRETLQQYKRDITGVCREPGDPDVIEETSTSGDRTGDIEAGGGGCEGCILNMQSTVQAFCIDPNAADTD